MIEKEGGGEKGRHPDQISSGKVVMEGDITNLVNNYYCEKRL